MIYAEGGIPCYYFSTSSIVKAISSFFFCTNTNTGSVLRQVAFEKYKQDHNLNEDVYSFSEQNLVEFFKGENVNLKKYITNSIKHSVNYIVT